MSRIDYALNVDADQTAEIARFVEAHGFSLTPGAVLPDALFAALKAEAAAQRGGGWSETTREASPYRACRAEPGETARAFLSHPDTLAFLERIFGEPMLPAFEASCFTYYENEGDFLARHKDRSVACAATLIVYLDVISGEAGRDAPGLQLHVFGREDTVDEPAVILGSAENAIAVGRGSRVWHERPPLGPGEAVTALTACFTPANFVVEAKGARDADLADTLSEEGYAAYRRGELERAHERFRQALSRDPECDMAWAGHGFAYWSRGLFELALAAFQSAARLDGASASHWSNIGLCLRDMGEPERALAAFRTSVSIDPAYAPAWNEWGNVLQDCGQADEALEFYYRALAIDPARAVVHHNLGVALTRCNEPMQAYHAFQEALSRDPGYSHALEELGVLYLNAGMTEAARDALQRAGTPRAANILAGAGQALPDKTGLISEVST